VRLNIIAYFLVQIALQYHCFAGWEQSAFGNITPSCNTTFFSQFGFRHSHCNHVQRHGQRGRAEYRCYHLTLQSYVCFSIMHSCRSLDYYCTIRYSTRDSNIGNFCFPVPDPSPNHCAGFKDCFEKNKNEVKYQKIWIFMKSKETGLFRFVLRPKTAQATTSKVSV